MKENSSRHIHMSNAIVFYPLYNLNILLCVSFYYIIYSSCF
nr:MAG TPA: hypothetical protein [Caudoviricetes sp.]